MVIIPEFEQACPFAGGFARVRTGRKWYYITSDGTRTIHSGFNSASDFNDELAAVQVAPRFSYQGKDPKTRTALGDPDMLLWGYIDRRGLFAIEPRFDWAQPFDGPLAMVKENGVIGYINRHGETVWHEETPTGSDTLMPFINK